MRPFLILVMNVAIALFSVATPPTAQADDWPLRVVRIITSFPVGTGADVSARLYAERLASRWGKSVIVENRPGADGIIAVTAFIGARDEHTLLYINGGPVTTNPFTHHTLPYDPAGDLVPISSGANVFVGISTPASLPVSTLAEFIKFARLQQGKLNWGATSGAFDYLIPGFLKSAGLDLAHVPYREIGPAMQDLAEARLHLYASALATQIALVRSGKVKVLAITNRERAPLVPDIPTVAESGFADLAFEGFLGFFGPRGMRSELRDQIGADIGSAGADPAIGAKLASSGLIVRTNTAAELSEIIKRERAKIGELARVAGRKPE